MTYLLSGDVGGTKTLLLLVESTASGIRVVSDERFSSDSYPSLESMLREFLEPHDITIDHAVFGTAGPAISRHASVTNLEWTLDAGELEKSLGIRSVEFINDFFAVAVGLRAMQGDSLVTLNTGKVDDASPVAILGAGTGLGEAVLLVRNRELIVLPSEGGHGDYAPVDEESLEVWRVLHRRFGHVSYERVISGQGIANLFSALRELRYPEDPMYAALEKEPDSLPARVAELAEKGDPLAAAVMRMFVTAYGAEAGNMALRSLARGGVYLAGGIAAKNLALFQSGAFLDAFFAKGRFENMMRDIPVHIIVDPRVGLAGALAWAGRE